MSEKNITGLNEYIRKKHEETVEKVLATIDKMKRNKKSVINFSTVAKTAGVSKATLYNNVIVKEKIMSLRDAKKEVNNEGSIDANREQQYREQIRKLKEDKENLIRQLVEMEDLRKEIKMLKEQIKRLKGSQC